ncbi:MAG: spermidine/putrescine ABC transporter substrate-binding protein [Desulfovibrio sp.]
MRKIFLALLMFALFALPAFAAQEEMRLFIWSEYMPEDFVPNFEKQTGIKVRVDLYESMDEMLAKLQAGGVSQYDVIVPSDYIIPTLIQLDLLKELDHAKLPNLKNLAETFVSPVYDPGNKFTAAYQWGTLGMLFDKNIIKDEQPSWGVMFDAQKRVGPFVLIDSVREMLGCAQSYMGMDVNTTDKTELKKLVDLMLETKGSEYFQGFDVGTGGRSKVVAHTAVAAIVYNGDALRAVKENPGIGFANPKEGTIAWVDNMAVCKGAPNPEAAYKFINYVLDAETGAALSNWTEYATPNKASMPFINEDSKNNPAVYPPEDYMKKLHFINDLGKDNRIYDEIWTMVKTR